MPPQRCYRQTKTIQRKQNTTKSERKEQENRSTKKAASRQPQQFVVQVA